MNNNSNAKSKTKPSVIKQAIPLYPVLPIIGPWGGSEAHSLWLPLEYTTNCNMSKYLPVLTRFFHNEQIGRRVAAVNCVLNEQVWGSVVTQEGWHPYRSAMTLEHTSRLLNPPIPCNYIKCNKLSPYSQANSRRAYTFFMANVLPLRGLNQPPYFSIEDSIHV